MDLKVYVFNRQSYYNKKSTSQKNKRDRGQWTVRPMPRDGDPMHLRSENPQLRISVAQSCLQLRTVLVSKCSQLRISVAQNIRAQNIPSSEYPYIRISVAENVSTRSSEYPYLRISVAQYIRSSEYPGSEYPQIGISLA